MRRLRFFCLVVLCWILYSFQLIFKTSKKHEIENHQKIQEVITAETQKPIEEPSNVKTSKLPESTLKHKALVAALDLEAAAPSFRRLSVGFMMFMEGLKNTPIFSQGAARTPLVRKMSVPRSRRRVAIQLFNFSWSHSPGHSMPT